jgi:hypothetical protein
VQDKFYQYLPGIPEQESPNCVLTTGRAKISIDDDKYFQTAGCYPAMSEKITGRGTLL